MKSRKPSASKKPAAKKAAPAASKKPAAKKAAPAASKKPAAKKAAPAASKKPTTKKPVLTDKARSKVAKAVKAIKTVAKGGKVKKGKVVKAVKAAIRAVGSSKYSASLALFLSQFDTSSALPRAAGGFARRTLESLAVPTLESLAFGGIAAAPPPPMVNLLVRCNEGIPAPLAGAGDQTALSGRGTVRTALVPVTQIAQLAARADVRRLSAPRELRPLMDIARPLVNLPAFRLNPATSATGQGVIIGIVDSGLDTGHAAFQGRVLGLWDQTVAGTGPGGDAPAYGGLLRPPALGGSVDTSGHGTHVAGIAAGQGSPYEGMAPAADLLIVKTNFKNSGILDGVHWIFAEAERLGRPAVVNLSLGGHWDGHDGEDDLSVGLNEESGPGRIVVAAAGNEGTDPIHARQEVAAGQPAAFTFDVAARSGPTPVPWLVLNGWYEGTGKCEVRVKNSSGQTTPWQGLLSGADAGNAGAMVHVLAGDKVTLSTPDSDNPNGDRQFLVEIDSDPQEPGLQGGRWTLEVRRKSGTPGTVHVWLLAHASLPPTAAAFSPGVAVASELIGSPGAATQVITVAAYTSRNQWVDNQGVARNVGMTLNTLADFSSPGPRRDGQPKPDVTAPGAMICAARSSGANPPTPARYVIGNEHRMNAGTSMACPLITGVVALLLEKNPQLTPDAARAFLKQHSTVPGKPKGTFDPHWGYGLLKLPS